MRQAAQQQGAVPGSHVQEVARSSRGGAAHQITGSPIFVDKGVITQAEFEQAKAKALS